MFKKFVIATLLLMPYAAQAEELARHDCSIFDRNPAACHRDPSCEYDSRRGTCDDLFDDPRRNCSQFDFDARSCNRQADCTFDSRTQRCEEDDFNPDPTPGDCWYFDNDPRRCELTRGCYYDRRNYQCLDDDFGPGPGPGGRDTWECTAEDEGHEEHRNGHASVGRTYQDAQWSAIEFCERYHGRCTIRSCRQIR